MLKDFPLVVSDAEGSGANGAVVKGLGSEPRLPEYKFQS